MSRIGGTSGVRRSNCAVRCDRFIASIWHNLRYVTGGFLFVLIMLFILVGTPVLLYNCHRAPGIVLEGFDIRNMAVFHNATATNSTPWQVSSDINLTLSFTNRNGVVGCFTTLLRMEVYVYYAGNGTISVSNVPLEFTLKPDRSRNVSTELLEARFLIVNDSIGSALAADLRSDNITLHVEIATRYTKANGKSDRSRTVCEVVARTPLGKNSRPESLLGKKCVNETYPIQPKTL